jgi:hypothetical protein
MSKMCLECNKRIYCVSNCIAYAFALLGEGKITKNISCPWKNQEHLTNFKRVAKIR